MNIFIGASSASDEIACHSFEAWNALLAAMDAGDHEAILRIALNERPEMVPTASLRPVATDALSEFADRYWKQHGAAKPAARATPAISFVEIGGES